ncbi:hypothetical protein IWX49DRAFT_585677 [Phyllosticta citricarpa]
MAAIMSCSRAWAAAWASRTSCRAWACRRSSAFICLTRLVTISFFLVQRGRYTHLVQVHQFVALGGVPASSVPLLHYPRNPTALAVNHSHLGELEEFEFFEQAIEKILLQELFDVPGIDVALVVDVEDPKQVRTAAGGHVGREIGSGHPAPYLGHGHWGRRPWKRRV